MRSAAGPWWSGLVLLACLFATWLAHLVISGEGNATLQWGAAAASGLPHAAAYGFLLWWFGRTLRDGREPLVTRIALRVHGALMPKIHTYTRQVTVAWCLFFAAQLAVSLILFVFAPLEIWSIFVMVNLPLVVLMFAGEYLVRVLRHPDHPRATVGSMLRAIANTR
jgi:uncharacterized membrane protein